MAEVASLLDDLLARTSRTFAIAIPCLPVPTRHEVTIAYLLLRVADTIEDSPHLSSIEKQAAFDTLASIFGHELQPQQTQLELPRPASDNPHYSLLLEELPAVLGAAAKLRPAARQIIAGSIAESIAGMKQFVTAEKTADGKIQLKSLDELRRYCYFVAGIVGELLTQLFLERASWLADCRAELLANARWFGEGLQLVNILKDSDEDRCEGRVFIPAQTPRSTLFKIAREDLTKAESYVATLVRAAAPRGFVAFTEIPLRLAWLALDCVEESGPGSKVPRNDVLKILAEATAELSSSEGIIAG